jgi:hypothetical protein
VSPSAVHALVRLIFAMAPTQTPTATPRYSYTNDAGLDKNTVFAGSWSFQVNEIEVFEITE